MRSSGPAFTFDLRWDLTVYAPWGEVRRAVTAEFVHQTSGEVLEMAIRDLAQEAFLEGLRRVDLRSALRDVSEEVRS